MQLCRSQRGKRALTASPQKNRIEKRLSLRAAGSRVAAATGANSFSLRFMTPLLVGISWSSKFGGLDQRVGVEPALHHVVAEQIDDREQRHALVMRHPLPDQRGAAQRSRVVGGLVEAVGATQPDASMRRRLRRASTQSTPSARKVE